MCAQFSLKIDLEFLIKTYGISTPANLTTIDLRFLPYQKAPVIVHDSGPRLVGMNFSLVPSWANKSKVKFATHNARLETVLEKPTWKKPFEKHHCVVPISSFFESVHDGPLSGNMIEFFEQSHHLLFAAGIFDVWQDKENPHVKIHSFAILTTEPDAFIFKNGHDRSPLFLDFENAKTWLTLASDSQKMITFLNEKNQKPSLSVKIDRPLKMSSLKRQKN